MKLGLDLDGVICDFNSAFAKLANEVLGRDLVPVEANPPRWDWLSAYCTQEEIARVWAEGHRRHFLRDLPWDESFCPVDTNSYTNQARERLIAICETHEVYFLTSRTGKDAKWDTEYWLTEHANIGCPTVLLTQEKGLAAKALQLDILIDDYPPFLLQTRLASPGTRLYLRRRRYNQDRHEFGTLVGDLAEMLDREGL